MVSTLDVIFPASSAHLMPIEESGDIVKSVNLNLKGIVGIAAFSHIAGYAGKTSEQATAASTARKMIARWATLA
jgi:hypothetical protein